jgi:hypothetical protein
MDRKECWIIPDRKYRPDGRHDEQQKEQRALFDSRAAVINSSAPTTITWSRNCGPGKR